MRMRKIPWAAEYLGESIGRVHHPEKKSGKWSPEGKKLHAEIGTGKGSYSLEMARKYPDEVFAAIEKNESAAGLAAKKFDQEKLPNLSLIYGDAADIENWFANGEVDVIHLNFSDPWPKKRNTKRRLSSPSFLGSYKKILKDGGEIQMKTDNADLFEYSLISFLNAGFTLEDVSVDYRRNPHPEDAITEYEAKFIEKNQPVYRGVFRYDRNSQHSSV